MELRNLDYLVDRPRIPTGTVTFLFTDIEGSTKRWERFGDAMREAVTRHDALLRRIFTGRGAHIFKTLGDAFCVAFSNADDAISAAMDAAYALEREDWSRVDGLRIRMALHAGSADERDGDYFGPVVNRVARLLATAHGGQIVLSAAARHLAEAGLPPGAALIDLGSHRLKDLSQPEHIAQLVAPGLPATFPVLNSLDSAKTNLPLQLAPLIGRDREVEAIAQLVRDKPLVTLCGAGGIGKTRLACQVGADVLAELPDGVWFIDLAPIGEAALVAGVLAATFCVPDVGLRNVTERVVAFLANKRLLLIFDNCEQVVAAAAAAVGAILRACSGVRVLVTTREALHISGEEILRIPSLAVPPATENLSAETALTFAAVELFVNRISSLAPFTLTDENAPIIADICRRLDGIALAIELAASRVKILSPRQVAQRLDERFRILTGGSRTALPRQQTLRALIDWSYDLLDERERTVFGRTSIFVASFDLDAAIAVCADAQIDEFDILDTIDALVDKSLVTVEPAGEERRYRLLESTRAYARERFGESGDEDATRARWLAYFQRIVRETALENRAQYDGESFKALEIENDNLRSVLEWSIAAAHEPIAGLEFAAWLGDYWVQNGLQPEGVLWLEAGLRLVDEATSKSTVAHAWLAVAALGQNLLLGKSGLDAAQRAVMLGGECNLPDVVALASLYVGIAFGRMGAYEEAETAFGAALEPLRALGNRRGYLKCLISQAFVATMRGREEVARDLYEQLIAIERDRKPTQALTAVTANLALLEFSCGNRARALELGREAVEYSRGLNDGSLQASLLVNLAAFLIDDERYDEAHGAAREALELGVERRYAIPLCIAIEHLALIAALRGEARIPARLIGFTEKSMQAAGFARETAEQRGYDRLLHILRAALGEAQAAGLMQDGRELAEKQAVELARAL